MNVLHLSTATSWRGGEQQVAYLIESLVPHVKNQYLICVKDSILSKRINNVSLIELDKPVFISLKWIKTVKAIVKQHEIDIIQIHESKSQTYAVLSSVFYKEIPPIVVTRRVIFPVKGILSRMKYTYPSVKKVVCISNAVKLEMQNVVKRNKLQVISSAVDIREFNYLDNVTFPFLDETKIKIANVSALTKEKDIKTFINTAKELLKERTNLKFYIIGEGRLKQELQDYVKELNLEDKIVFTGFIKNIKQLILQLDMLLFTSKKEGLGTTVIDFFLAKKPVVATDSIGVRDLIVNKNTGMLCKQGDVKSLKNAVLEILENESLKNKLVLNAFNLAIQNHSVKNLGMKYFLLYNEIIDRHSC